LQIHPERAMKRFIFVLLLAIIVTIPGIADGGWGMGTLAGTVLGPSGAPVAGARVTSQNADGQHPQATVTNAQGRFFFPQLVHGLYDVRAYHNGVWSEWKQNIAVYTGEQTEVTLRLPGKTAKAK
jgi:Carboxypeptidase regulatory-like domain